MQNSQTAVHTFYGRIGEEMGGNVHVRVGTVGVIVTLIRRQTVTSQNVLNCIGTLIAEEV